MYHGGNVLLRSLVGLFVKSQMYFERFSVLAILLVLLPASALAQSIDVGRGAVGVHVPPSYDSGTPMPLVLLLHGYTSSGSGHEGYMKFTPLADEFGFLYLHPDGRIDAVGNRFWSGTDACCNFYGASDDDDDYLMALINEMKSQYNVDPLRVYLIGHSNGGFMSYRMACDHSDTIAAIASLAGATFFDPLDCQPAVPVHVLQIHGTSDGTILYVGGSLGGTAHPGAVATVQQWTTHNGCALVADTSAPNIDLERNLAGNETTVTRYYTSCNPEGSAELWTIVGGIHSPAFSATFSRQVVEFLYAHPKDAPAAGSLDEAWVDFDWIGSKYGSEDTPFDTLGDALTAAAPSATVKIKGDTGDSVSNQTMTINQAVTIEAVNGAVRIGDAGGRGPDTGRESGFVSRE